MQQSRSEPVILCNVPNFYVYIMSSKSRVL